MAKIGKNQRSSAYTLINCSKEYTIAKFVSRFQDDLKLDKTKTKSEIHNFINSIHFNKFFFANFDFEKTFNVALNEYFNDDKLRKESTLLLKEWRG